MYVRLISVLKKWCFFPSCTYCIWLDPRSGEPEIDHAVTVFPDSATELLTV